jgi:hypothetical protein
MIHFCMTGVVNDAHASSSGRFSLNDEVETQTQQDHIVLFIQLIGTASCSLSVIRRHCRIAITVAITAGLEMY